MKKTPENITAYGVFLTFRSFDLENSKRACDETKKQAITRPNRTNGLGYRPSLENKTQRIPLRLHAFLVIALYSRHMGACLITLKKLPVFCRHLGFLQQFFFIAITFKLFDRYALKFGGRFYTINFSIVHCSATGESISDIVEQRKYFITSLLHRALYLLPSEGYQSVYQLLSQQCNFCAF
jgi:hypothetical protein